MTTLGIMPILGIMARMIPRYHIEMTREALAPHFSERALQMIISANIHQDDLPNQFGHDEIHYDNNAIDAGDRYINEQRGYILAALMLPGNLGAWVAFGRLIHTAQDFYAHTNYVALWLDEQTGTPPTPAQIDPLKKDLIQSPSLCSGKIYFPMDMLAFLPIFRPLALKLLPKDSHGWMNLDAPNRGFKFDYARAAAIKRTLYEFELLQKLLPPEMFARFTDK